MDTLGPTTHLRADPARGFLRAAIVGLTLTTALIHASLGGLLFTINALGYAALALAMVLPGPFARARWLTRLGLLGFTAATIGGWILFGARFPLAYVDKGVESVLIVLLAVEVVVEDGGPFAIARRLRDLLRRVIAVVAGPTAR